MILENVIQIKSEITRHVRVSMKIRKKICVCEKDQIWNLAKCRCENGKYLGRLLTVSDYVWWNCRRNTNSCNNLNRKNAICKTKNFYIVFAFLLITIALLVAVSIYPSMIKYETKEKHLLP